MQNSDWEELYDSAVDYAMHNGGFNYESLKKDLCIDDNMAEWVISQMVINNVVADLGEGNFINIGDRAYKEKRSGLVVKYNNKSKYNVLVKFLSLIVLIPTCYLLYQEPIALIVLILTLLVSFVFCDKYKSLNYGFVTIFISVAMILFVHYQKPLWGIGRDKINLMEEIKMQAEDESSKDAKKIAEARVFIRESMKDPSSAIFSNEYVGKSGAACGFVNGRNGFGAYAGKQRFFVVGSTSYIDDGTQYFSSAWKNNCS